MEDYAGFEPQIGEITALRTFRIGPGGALYPLYSDRPWSDGRNTARCNVPSTAGNLDHIAPEPDCTCGYYAFADEAGAAELPHAKHVLAVVACWGRVIAGTRGIRAEHTRVEAIWMSDVVPADLAELVVARYPATAVFVDKAAMLTEHPPTSLDCYETAADSPISHRWWAWWAVIVAALIVTLPVDLVWHHQNAQFGWAAGVLPVLQIAAIGLIQRRQIGHEARRFPARIASLEQSRRWTHLGERRRPVPDHDS